MKNRNYVTGEKQKCERLFLAVLLLIFGIGSALSSADAAVCSSQKNDGLKKDSDALVQKILVDSKLNSGEPAFKQVSLKDAQKPILDILDGKLHKVDRNNELLKQMNSVGLITGNEISSNLQTSGSAVLIDKCYVLTARHVVQAVAKAKRANFEIGLKSYFSVGQNRSCEGSDPFAYKNIQAKLVAFGETEDFQDEWAILKLEKPVDKSIKPAHFFKGRLADNQTFYRTGYPYQTFSDSFGNSALRAQVDQVSRVTPIFFESKIGNDSDGTSGGGIFIGSSDSDQPALQLAGINVREKTSLPIKYILSALKNEHKSVVEEMIQTKKEGTCDNQ